MPMTAPLPSLVSDPNHPLDLTGRHVHFVGIGGCGMSGLARIARAQGACCTGSDQAASNVTALLERDGFRIVLNQTAASVPDQAELVVASAAVKPEHPELAEARRRGVPTLKYAQLLGRLMLGRTGVAVAGTHGKSTTTSMLSHVLIQAGLDPSLIVGANCRQIGGGSRVGGSDILVAEACEYDRSFHNFHPTHALILNVELDHFDVYASLDEVVESFAGFARQVPREGSLLINHEMSGRLAITAGLDCAIETIGFAPQADWQVEIVQMADGESPAMEDVDDRGRPLARLWRDGQAVLEWTPPLPGEHMAYNAAAAAVTAHRLGAGWDAIRTAIESFRGLDRRMQLLGHKEVDGVHPTAASIPVVDDYGHHPTEVDTTLRALRRFYNPRRLICVFQPHQHSRTRFLMQQFAASFSEADLVIVPDIYFSRDSETERRAVTAADLVDRLRHQGVQAMHLYPFEAIVEQLQVIGRPGDLVVTMGAGDVWKVARDFLSPR